MGFKHSTISAKAYKVDNRWYIKVGDEQYTLNSFSKEFGTNQTTIKDHILQKSEEEFTAWLRHRLDLSALGLHPQVRLFRKGDECCWSTCVATALDCTTATANSRLHAWMAGRLDTDDLFNPFKAVGYTQASLSFEEADWGDLTNKKRDDNLNGMKAPGTWEKEQDMPEAFIANSYSGHSCGTSSGPGCYLKGD